MSDLGYSKSEAQRLKDHVDREVAKIEGTAENLRQIVSDTDPNVGSQLGGIDALLEDFRLIGYQLHEVIDRRTRK